ncbi:hypothetical protein [Arthrobacter sp. ES1]|uniref:hypothetical protein n=1 Tax=Arthrobacter sp. ES1 TaxID=1897056 RepID=UPI001CFFF9B1|nr:hypothetical protein [Arthrobacter sp. ES1]MCB5280479.1 hypothetical protein [Arthrobacter sp. ES1]
MPLSTAHVSAPAYIVHTEPGDGSPTVSDSFPTAQSRLDSLRQRAQEYFPGRDVPRTPSDTDEAAYLAQLLGFFLMLHDGEVTLENVTDT